MKRILILLVAAAAFAGCSAGANFKTDGAAGVGAKWDGGPRVDAKIPSIDVGVNAGAVPGALPPLVGGATNAPAASAPSPDPEVLKRLDDIGAKIAEAEKAGSKTPEEIAALKAELDALRTEEKSAPPEPKPIIQTVTEKAPGFIAKILSGDIMGAVTGPEGILGTIVSLWLARKGASKVADARKKRKDRMAALEKALGMTPAPKV